MMLLPPGLPTSGAPIAHPVAAGLCFLSAFAVFFTFVRAYGAANGAGPGPGERPAWNRGMSLRLLATGALWALGLWISSLPA